MANNPNVAKILDAIRATPGKKALIIVDIQNDFLPNGPMAVPDGDSVIPVIHEILKCKDVFDGGIFAR